MVTILYHYMKIDVKLIVIVAFTISTLSAAGQGGKELRGSVNTQSFNDIYPSISGDGNTLVFMNDYTDNGGYITLISRKEKGGQWSVGIELEVLNPARLNAPGGYCLSFDGNTLVYSTLKGEGVGGYDLWFLEYDGSKWSNPKNFGVPLNSPLNDTYPTFSTDGNKLYFTRCGSINKAGGEDCKLYVSDRKRGRIKGWEAPVELDEIINGGGATMPRMLSDNRTLIFSSGKSGGKGGLDWYLTRMASDGSWSNPKNINYINTPEDDIFYTMYYRPDKAITCQKNRRDIFNMVEVDVPEQFQPDKVVIKMGKILNSRGEPVDSDVRVRDYENGESGPFTFPDTETGEYALIIPEGKIYDFSIVPKRGSEFYYSEILDYTTLRSSRKESSDYTLQIPVQNAVLSLKNVKFLPQTDQTDSRNNEEITRLVRLLNRNENYRIEIAAYQDSIMTDSIPHPGLTEVIVDTTFWEEYIYEYDYNYQYSIDQDSAMLKFPEFTNVQLDSMLTIWNDSLSRVRNDTILAERFLASLIGIDTVENVVDTIQHVDVKYTYHNDLTQKRADQLAAVITARDIDPERITPVGYGDRKKPITAIKEDEFEDGFIEIIFKR